MSKIWRFGYLLGAMACVAMIVACGTGSNTTSEFGKGNMISGTLQIGAGSSGVAQSGALQSNGLSPYGSSEVLLVNRIGNILDRAGADGSGNFYFDGLEHNDYIVRVVDTETLSIVTEVKIGLVNGDDVTIAGVITNDVASWRIAFKANDSVMLQGESQQINARDLSDASPRSFDEIIAMRAGGMGWGEIALMLDVSPMVLGLTYEDGFANEKTTDVTAENIGSSSQPV